MKTIKLIIILSEILFLITAGILIYKAAKDNNSLGLWGYICAAIWCLNCLLRDIKE
jgi:hypothetical protein